MRDIGKERRSGKDARQRGSGNLAWATWAGTQQITGDRCSGGPRKHLLHRTKLVGVSLVSSALISCLPTFLIFSIYQFIDLKVPSTKNYGDLQV